MQPRRDYVRFRLLNRAELVQAELALAQRANEQALAHALRAEEMAAQETMRKNLARAWLLQGRALLALGLLRAVSLNAQTPQPVFENPAEVDTKSGYIKLNWRLDDLAEFAFEVEQSASPDFASTRVIYAGPDYATFLSGLRNGIYYYRVRAVGNAGPGAWSEAVKVRVEHHSLTLAFTLFSIGALVFLITVGIVVQGTRAASRNR